MSFIYGVEILNESVKVAIFEKHLRTIRALEVRRHIFESTDRYQETAKLLSDLDYNNEDDRLVVIYDKSKLSFRLIDLPVANVKIVKDTLPGEIELITPFETDQIILDYSIVENLYPADNVVSVSLYITLKEDFEQELENLKSVGLDPDSIVPHPATLITDISNLTSPIVSIEATGESLAIALCYNGAILSYSYQDLFDSSNKIDEIIFNIKSDIALTKLALKRRKPNFELTNIILSGELSESPLLLEKLESDGVFKVERASASSGEVKIHDDRRTFNALSSFSSFASCYNAAMLSTSKELSTLNFRKGIYKKKISLTGIYTQLALVAILLVAVGILAFISFSLESAQSKAEYAHLKDLEQIQFYRAVDSSVEIVDAKVQLSAKLEELRKTAKALGQSSDSLDPLLPRLVDISKSLPADIVVEISQLVYEAEQIFITGYTGSFEDLERIKKSLESISWAQNVKLSDAKNRPGSNNVLFKFEIEVTW
ncbi:MAG: PilN domain-containing protein [Nitrospinota bacterium]